MPKSAKPVAPSAPEFRSWDEVSAAGKTVIDLDNSAAQLQAELDKAAAELTAEYEPRISELVKQSELVKTGMRVFTDAHRREFAPGAKSKPLTHCTVGYRDRPAAVEFLLKKAEDVISAIREAGFGRFIKTPPPKPAVDKAALKTAAEAGEVDAATLKGMGVKIVQAEDFYVSTSTSPVIVN